MAPINTAPQRMASLAMDSGEDKVASYYIPRT